jgi:hypothetical protein
MITAIEYALMAGAAYISSRDPINQLPTPKGWLTTRHDNPPDGSGFEAISFINGTTIADSTDIVISFAGTGPFGSGDWLHGNIPSALGNLSDQLRHAATYYLDVQSANPGAHITFTGHSLGGGLASLMAVMFNTSASTFDQAPFRNSALTYTTADENGNVTTQSVAQALLIYLSGETNANGQPYTASQLQKLTDYVSALSNAAPGIVPNECKVTNINVQGEFLSTGPWTNFKRIGTPVPNIQHGPTDISAYTELHDIALLTTFLQSRQTAATGQTLNDVTFKLTDLLKLVFDRKLFANETDTRNRNFLENLVRHQVGVGKQGTDHDFHREIFACLDQRALRASIIFHLPFLRRPPRLTRPCASA